MRSSRESRTGTWIGIELSAHIQDRYVEVGIPEKKVKKLKEATAQLLSKTMRTVRALKMCTGQTNWDAGTLLTAVGLRPSSTPSSLRRTRTTRTPRKVAPRVVLRWFWLLGSGVNGAVVRRRHLDLQGAQAP